MANKVLVTGGKGFIGSRLVRRLKCDSVDLVDGQDIRKIRLDKYDIVYHLAALRSVPRSFNEPHAFFDVNVWGTYNIAIQSKRFVNISSSSVYTAKSPYALSKACAEVLGEKHPNCVNLRLFNVFGEGQTSDALIPTMIKKMARNEDVKIYGDGFQERDFTYIDDVVSEIIRYGESELTGTFDIGYGAPHSVNEVFALLACYFDYKKKAIYLDERQGDFRRTQANNTIPDGIGFYDGLARTVKWWKD